VDNAVVRWYLRHFRQVEYVNALPRDTFAEAIITPLGAELGLPQEYTGADFGLVRPETEHLLDPLAALRWWAFRQSTILPREERVILWLRSDLILP
jgi:hypothetical protein